jgi:hypothetical protein
MAPYADSIYANYLDRDATECVEAAYGENYERLVEAKTEWDSGNLFRMNRNIEPGE